MGTSNYKFFQHPACEYFPCHQIDNLADFNCLFCYCPLYALGENCGGCFSYTDNGIKNCSQCSFPHHREQYDAVLEKLGTLVEQLKTTKI
ncbi:MAG: cysteine-rich small domain-containing protein [Acetobacterium sp.]|nr:cysteine-rich small domain-containing protein [Acetobacterium sp.]